MKLKTPIKYDSHVRPVCLATSDFDAGTKCFVTGWGHTSEGGNIARVNFSRTLFLTFPHLTESQNLQPIVLTIIKTVRLNAIFLVEKLKGLVYENEARGNIHNVPRVFRESKNTEILVLLLSKKVGIDNIITVWKAIIA